MHDRTSAHLAAGHAPQSPPGHGCGPSTLDERAPGVPEWAGHAVELDDADRVIHGPVAIRRGARGAILSIVLRGAAGYASDELEARVVDAYAAIARSLGGEGPRASRGLHAVRFWNFIPGIHDGMIHSPGEGPLSRYMVFNKGRFRAFRECAPLNPGTSGIATATGVGHLGPDLIIHCMAWHAPGRPIENPRQVPAYRYSARYGPRPPCFARGTRVDGAGGRLLLIGGTASVVGEASVHAAGEHTDLADQVEETLTNIETLIQTADEESTQDRAASSARGWLSALTHIRVYSVRASDQPAVAALLRPRLAPGAAVEFVRADICRPELLVEIEGVARLKARSLPGKSGHGRAGTTRV